MLSLWAAAARVFLRNEVDRVCYVTSQARRNRSIAFCSLVFNDHPKISRPHCTSLVMYTTGVRYKLNELSSFNKLLPSFSRLYIHIINREDKKINHAI